MLIGKSILNFLDLLTEQVLVKLLKKKTIFVYNNYCVQYNHVLVKTFTMWPGGRIGGKR